MTTLQTTLKNFLWDYGLDNAYELFGVILITDSDEDVYEIFKDSVVREIPYGDRDISPEPSYWDYRYVLERFFNHDTEIVDLEIAFEEEEYEQIMCELEDAKKNIDNLSMEYLADLLSRIGYSRLTFYNVSNKRYYIYTPNF